MKTKLYAGAVLVLMLSVGASYAQSQPGVHKAKIRPTPEERTARREDVKAKLAAMTPAERKAFKQAHREKQQARLNAMTPEQRTKVEERRRIHKETKQSGK
ncbi:hypothetical protein [Spirosoma arcticum]